MDDGIEDKLAELQEQLLIDRNDLDTMLIKQPQLYRQVGDGFAEAESFKDRAKDSLEAEVAKLDAYLRRAAAETKEKFTEPQLANMIKLQDSYVKVWEEYIRCKELSGKWKSLLESFSQRSYMLNHLVTLYVSGYWGQATGASSRQQAVSRASDDIRDIVDKERRRRG